MSTELVIAIFGVVLGGIGTIISILSYRHASKVKKLDLFVEVGRARNALHSELLITINLHGKAMEERKAVASAIGLLRSGPMVRWQSEWDQHKVLIGELSKKVPKEDMDYSGFSPDALSREILELDRTLKLVQEIRDIYLGWSEWDDTQRRELRNDQRVSTAAKFGNSQ